MKRIIGFFTTVFLVLSIAAVGFAFQEDMMKKQPSMMKKKTMVSKSISTRKYRKQIKHSKFHKHYKGRKMVRKSTLK